jgi:hypothetical protein
MILFQEEKLGLCDFNTDMDKPSFYEYENKVGA